MIDINIAALRPIGLSPRLEHSLHEQLERIEPGGLLMRLVEVHRETLRLHDGNALHVARPLPRLVHALERAGASLAVGDWVVAREAMGGDLWIGDRLVPLSTLTRREADGRRHVLASNIDTAVLVMGLDDDFNPRRLERYLTLTMGRGMRVLVVLTKADVVSDARRDESRYLLGGRVPVDVEVVAVNATRPDAAAVFAPYLGVGQTLVLLGSSGAGKSTLTNALLGAAVQDTGGVRPHDSRGKHTTTSRSLHVLPVGGCVIDTPGLRTLRPDLDAGTLAASFADVEALAPQCRFRDCRHVGEPGCVVRLGVPADRLDNYQKLLRESRRDALTPMERRRQLLHWKALDREAGMRSRAKRGG